MTEYEIADLTTSIMANYLTGFSIFVTMISAYVIAAFVAGARLTRSQAIFINLCFIVVTALTSFQCAIMLGRALSLNLQSSLSEVGGPAWGPRAAYLISALVHTPIVIGSLWFMHRVRGART